MNMVLDTEVSKSELLMVSYLVHYDTLLQKATDIITNSDSYFITKCGRC